MKRSISAFLLICACMLALAGCKSGQKEKPPDPEPEPQEETFTLPLTGLQTNDQDTYESRPVAVVVNNDPKARPQTGLNEADVIFEVLAEGNITRYLAIFQSEKPETVGPVRSARPYFIDLANGYDAFFVAHGYSPEAKMMLDSGAIDHINGIAYDGTLFQRASFRKAPHNSYITYENIAKGAEENGHSLVKTVPPLLFLSEEEMDGIQGDSAAEATVRYSSSYSVTYSYDEAANEYTRWIGSEQMADYETNEPKTLANILIIEANHRILDDVGRKEIDLASGGNAILLQNGKVRQLQWANENGRIVPKTSEGAVGFVPGQTWIHIVPASPGLNQIVQLSNKETE